MREFFRIQCGLPRVGLVRLVREGRDKGQGVGYLNDGTMVVVNNGAAMIGQQVEVQVQSTLQTGAGIIIFADVKRAGDTAFLQKEAV